jgi:hypothetical protein
MNSQPSYILCRCRTGLNDCLNQLWEVTRVAKHLNREILFQMPLYRATKISDILDFSKYTVPVHVDEEAEKRLQTVTTVFPDNYKPFLNDVTLESPTYITCNTNMNVPRTTLIVHDSPGGGFSGHFVLLRCLFNEAFVKSFYERYSPPPVYYTIHVRNTDLTTNLGQADQLISKFVSEYKTKPIYILTDNPETREYLVTRYGLRKTPTAYVEGHTCLHSAGATNTNILMEAFYDLCLIAISSGFLPVPCENRGVAGFGCLAQALQGQRKKMMVLLKRRD